MSTKLFNYTSLIRMINFVQVSQKALQKAEQRKKLVEAMAKCALSSSPAAVVNKRVHSKRTPVPDHLKTPSCKSPDMKNLCVEAATPKVLFGSSL